MYFTYILEGLSLYHVTGLGPEVPRYPDRVTHRKVTSEALPQIRFSRHRNLIASLTRRFGIKERNGVKVRFI